MAKSVTKAIGILTAGGDCPGLNAAIRSIGKAALGTYDIQVIGIAEGFHGLINDQTKVLGDADFSGILTRGGTILGSSREKPFAKKDTDPLAEHKVEMVLENYKNLHLDCLVCIGGNGTQTAAYKLSQLDINVLGLPKTIDNDLAESDFTFGFMSAVNVTTEAIDRLHTTAHSHSRIMVLETMGHKAGWLALYSGIAGGGDVILLPEIPYSPEIIAEHLINRARKGKEFSIVVVAEGARSVKEAEQRKKDKAAGKKKKKTSGPSAGYQVAAHIEKTTGLETRVTVLGYLPRGGTPSPFDRQLATGLGAEAVRLLVKGEYNRMVCLKKGVITSVPLEKVAGKTKKVPPDHALIAAGRLVGTCFGD
ncbi:MAG: 6-phosphofructokinase [Planctomycetes bacterium]|nr:6-phosphofructokinase [Planctomycetota bacterium]